MTTEADVDPRQILISAPIAHAEGCTSLLRSLYALVIAAELERLAGHDRLLSPALLLDRADFLRDGARRDARAEVRRQEAQS